MKKFTFPPHTKEASISLLVIVALAGIGIGIYFIVSHFKNSKGNGNANNTPPAYSPAAAPDAKPPAYSPAAASPSSRPQGRNQAIGYFGSNNALLPSTASPDCAGVGQGGNSLIPSTGNALDTLIIAFAYPKQTAYPCATCDYFNPVFELLEWGGVAQIGSNTCIAKWLREFKADGKEVFISVGGAGGGAFPHANLDAMYTAWSGDLARYTAMLTAWLVQFKALFGFELDGIDFDYEYFTAGKPPTGTNAERCQALIDITNATRSAPSLGQLKISHAPQIPYLVSNNYSSGMEYIGIYVAVMNGCGDSIDFLNVQNYNNGANTTNYAPDTCGRSYFLPNAWKELIQGTSVGYDGVQLKVPVPPSKLKFGVLIGTPQSSAPPGTPNSLQQPFTIDQAFTSWNFSSGVLPTGLMTWQITNMDDDNAFKALIDKAASSSTGTCNPAAPPPVAAGPAIAGTCIQIKNTTTEFYYSYAYGSAVNTICSGQTPLVSEVSIIPPSGTMSIDINASSSYRFLVQDKNKNSVNNISFDVKFSAYPLPTFTLTNADANSTTTALGNGAYAVDIVCINPASLSSIRASSHKNELKGSTSSPSCETKTPYVIAISVLGGVLACIVMGFFVMRYLKNKRTAPAPSPSRKLSLKRTSQLTTPRA